MIWMGATHAPQHMQRPTRPATASSFSRRQPRQPASAPAPQQSARRWSAGHHRAPPLPLRVHRPLAIWGEWRCSVPWARAERSHRRYSSFFGLAAHVPLCGVDTAPEKLRDREAASLFALRRWLMCTRSHAIQTCYGSQRYATLTSLPSLRPAHHSGGLPGGGRLRASRVRDGRLRT